jgi:hypothetical protein
MLNTSIRRWHSYIGLFIAPSVLFFALTGIAQIYSLHESHGNYVPPAIVEKLSSVHKDQVFASGHHHAEPAPDADQNKHETDSVAPGTGASAAPGVSVDASKGASADAKDEDDKPALSTVLLKGFFCFVAVCLALSTTFGLWMGLTQIRQKRLAWLLVIAGAVLPVGLLIL